MNYKRLHVFFLSFLFLFVTLSGVLNLRNARCEERLEHEILYEKYKNAPEDSDEKEEYYRQYSKAYSDYNAKKKQKPAASQKNEPADDKLEPENDSNEDSSAAEIYEKYKKEEDPEQKQQLYLDYLKKYSEEHSGDKDKGQNKEKNDKKTSGKKTNNETSSDKKQNGEKHSSKKSESAEELKTRADSLYEKYINAPADSEEKEQYFAQYQKAYRAYQDKLSGKLDKDETVISNKPKYAAAGQPNYLADTPATPVPAVSGGGGGNVFKKLFSKVELSTEKLIGAQTCAALELLYGIDKNSDMNARLNRVSSRIAAISDRRDLDYKIKILKMEDVNAFAVPGGAIYVTSAMMDFISSDSELAFILGHEMGHQVAKHSIKAFEKAMLIDYFLRTSKAGVIKNNQQALEIANMFLSMKYSRENEFEADRYGFKYATLTGYSPYGGVAFFDKLKNKYEKSKTPAFLRLFQTHPSTHDRLIESQNMASGFVSSHPQWKNSAPILQK